ncbi:MAG: hypothetical protein BAJATHORv1_10246 [Candidatus Thorarchaeota archaeon]|nr:MAG: hypothetical protein BAJATHORv1_10246 [Candidatus Thorarchaeota archaeon]
MAMPQQYQNIYLLILVPNRRIAKPPVEEIVQHAEDMRLTNVLDVRLLVFMRGCFGNLIKQNHAEEEKAEPRVRVNLVDSVNSLCEKWQITLFTIKQL